MQCVFLSFVGHKFRDKELRAPLLRGLKEDAINAIPGLSGPYDALSPTPNTQDLAS